LAWIKEGNKDAPPIYSIAKINLIGQVVSQLQWYQSNLVDPEPSSSFVSTSSSSPSMFYLSPFQPSLIAICPAVFEEDTLYEMSFLCEPPRS
jgi:hypothetical protein